jgi:Ni,Fe-hydrogenase III component G
MSLPAGIDYERGNFIVGENRMKDKGLLTRIKEILPTLSVEEFTESGNEIQFSVLSERLPEVVGWLLGEGLHHLSAITCFEMEDGIYLLYHFWHFGGLTLRVVLEKDQPRLSSLTPLIPGAEFYEREVKEMIGVEFDGLSNSQPLFLPENWQSPPPLRKTQDSQIKSSPRADRDREVHSG